MEEGTGGGGVNRVCPDDHAHGRTGTCYNRHACRCGDCREWNRVQRRRIRWASGHRFSVPNHAVVRRVRALQAVGWSLRELSKRLGRGEAYAYQLSISTGSFTHATFMLVDRVYRELWDQAPPLSTARERTTYNRAIASARRKGFVPPLGWDDIDRDPEPPSAPEAAVIEFDHAKVEQVVDGADLPLTYDERRAVVYRLDARGMTREEMAARLGLPRSTVDHALRSERRERKAA